MMNRVPFFDTGICLICLIFIASLFSSLKHTGRKSMHPLLCPTEDTEPVLTPSVSPLETLDQNVV